jgi:3',5'-cyclic AMP phosphodiesterase CpdA
MFRIVHISDLHLEDAQARSTHQTFLHSLAKILGKSLFDTAVDARGHNPEKLEALENVCRFLRPNAIIVTGDLTNFGDRKSFELAATTLEHLKTISGANHIICIPGNHDSLVERVLELRHRSRLTRFFIDQLAKLVREVDIPRQLSRQSSEQLKRGEEAFLLQSYGDVIAQRYGRINPSEPIFLTTDWGVLAVFLFDSTNDAGLMANEGRIGPHQFNLLNRYLQNPSNTARLQNAIRIALLHHHPISAPGAYSSAPERGYNSMRDGTQFLDYMNYNAFHFVLHGHEHVPFHCTISYSNQSVPGLHIVAAGSALQGTDSTTGSFNVIDILSPFEARLRRFDYQSTGYQERADLDARLAIRPSSDIRLSAPGEAETAADSALRNLFRGRNEAYDETNHYEEMEFDVTISSNHVYVGRYRRKGEVVTRETTRGPIFIITGSPAMTYHAMAVKAEDNLNSSAELGTELLLDRPHQKIIQVLHPLELPRGRHFDVTLAFQWQASADQPNDFDGINLMYFRYGLDYLKYRIQMPWDLKQPRVSAFGTQEAKPDLEVEDLDKTRRVYRFEIRNPRPLVYLISLEPM